VDTQDAEKHSRRADLFIVAPNAALVSIEVKYVAAGRTPSVRQCVSQVRQHLSAHSVNLLVVYAAEPVSIRLEASMQQIFDQLVHETAFVVGIVGPPIAFD
jgi:hypothetical protein